MATPIVPLNPELLPAVIRFCEATWHRPRTASFYRWRYLEAPLQKGWLVLRDQECLAMLLAFARPYRRGSEVLRFLEVHDWYALPGLKGAGLGVRLIRHAMGQPEPVLMVGGSEDSRQLMPRLGYGTPATVRRFMLPVSDRALSAALRKRVPWAGAAADLAGAIGVRTWFRPRRARCPAGGRVVPVGSPGRELDALYEEPSHYATVALWPQPHLAWLMHGHPAAGHYIPLYFTIGDALRGFALGRVVPTERGTEASIVTMYAPHPAPGLCAWMVGELVAALASHRPEWITAGTSCPLLADALRAHHFLPTGDDPVWVAPRATELPAPQAIGLDTGDTPLLPYPERWWDAPSGD